MPFRLVRHLGREAKGRRKVTAVALLRMSSFQTSLAWENGKPHVVPLQPLDFPNLCVLACAQRYAVELQGRCETKLTHATPTQAVCRRIVTCPQHSNNARERIDVLLSILTYLSETSWDSWDSCSGCTTVAELEKITVARCYVLPNNDLWQRIASRDC